MVDGSRRISHLLLDICLFFGPTSVFTSYKSGLILFRRLSYKFFIFQHIVSAITYLVFLFLHTRDLFTSWIYLWATVAIYGGAIAVRMIGTAWWSVRISKASISALVDNAVSVKIEVLTTKGQWKAGQHVFIRFLALAPFRSHPFTIASIEEDGELNLIIKQQKGLTRTLYNKVIRLESSWITRVLIDGPYGGPNRDPGSFDTVVLVAGGVGVTFTLPIMKDLVRRMQDLSKIRCSNVQFIWTVRSESTLAWIMPEIEDCVSIKNGVQAELYVTNANLGFAKRENLDPNISINYRRPNLSNVLSMAAAQNQGRMCVFGAGPKGLVSSLNTEVAKLQKGVIRDRGSTEIFLHAELFGG